MELDHLKVAELLRAASAQEILPRWRNLQQQDVEEKSPDEVVTTADRRCEQFLCRQLLEILPGSQVVGEEGAHARPELLQALHSDTYVWIVDPLDGTRNFAAGRPPFGIMVCLARRGEVLAAWLYDPLSDTLTSAERGCGAYQGSTRLLLDGASLPLGQMRGALLTKFLPPALKPTAEAAATSFRAVEQSYCAAYDYAELASSRMQFLFYYRTLVWDHAPGVLIAQEAGAVATRLDGTDYLITDDRGGLLVAANPDTWHEVAQAVVPSVAIIGEIPPSDR